MMTFSMRRTFSSSSQRSIFCSDSSVCLYATTRRQRVKYEQPGCEQLARRQPTSTRQTNRSQYCIATRPTESLDYYLDIMKDCECNPLIIVISIEDSVLMAVEHSERDTYGIISIIMPIRQHHKIAFLCHVTNELSAFWRKWDWMLVILLHA